jgi:hypothetical protein
MKKSNNTLSNYTINVKPIEEKVIEERKPIILMTPFTKLMGVIDGLVLVALILLLANNIYYGWFYLFWFVMRLIDIGSFYRQQKELQNEKES